MPLIIFHLYRALLYELRVTIKNIKKKVTSSGDPKIGAGNNKIMPEKYREKRD